MRGVTYRQQWLHEKVDELHTTLASYLLPKVFRHGCTSPSFDEHLAAVQLQLPAFSEASRYTVQAQSLVGELQAGLLLRLAPQPGLPVIVYHHGIAEMPAAKSFWGIFRPRQRFAAHLVAVRAPWHRTWGDLIPGLATLSNFLAMSAVSIRLIEAVRQRLIARGARGSLIVGSSLGGFLTLVHHLRYGTANGYIPLLAGPDIAHVMLATPYRRLLSPQASEQEAHIRALLDLRQPFLHSDTSRVFPLLARYDRTMSYAHHLDCYTAGGVSVVTIERGHLTGCGHFSALRAHVLTHLQPLVRAAVPHTT